MTRKQERAGITLDEVSKAIIEELQADGRRSYAAIGKVVGLSDAAVRQRVQRLVESGVMQIVAVTDPLQLGFARQAMIGVNVDGPLESVGDALADLEEVDYVVITAGRYDLLVEVVAETDDHLLELISGKIREVEGVVSTETFITYADLSLWHATAGDRWSPRAALDGDTDCDVVVVGAGFTGLWTAYYLAEADPSLRIVVIEAETAGFGASG
eukprot:gene32304-36467_t